jgi:hypothetical protein
MKWSSGITEDKNVRNLKICKLCIGIIVLGLSGCATTTHSIMPNQEMNHQFGEETQSAGGLVLTKREDGLQTVLYLGSDVATKTVVGFEIYDTFRRHGWIQVTHADASNDTEADVICRLGGHDITISAQCFTNGRVAQTPPATGSVTVDQNIIDQIGIDRVRNALVDLVMRQRTIVVNMAVEKRLQGH